MKSMTLYFEDAEFKDIKQEKEKMKMTWKEILLSAFNKKEEQK